MNIMRTALMVSILALAAWTPVEAQSVRLSFVFDSHDHYEFCHYERPSYYYDRYHYDMCSYDRRHFHSTLSIGFYGSYNYMPYRPYRVRAYRPYFQPNRRPAYSPDRRESAERGRVARPRPTDRVNPQRDRARRSTQARPARPNQPNRRSRR